MKQKIKNHFKNSIEIKKKILDSNLYFSISTMGKIAAKKIEKGGKIFFCGNGGSAADAQHLAAELLVRLKPENNRKGLLQGLILTVLLGFVFSCFQAYEYHHATFTISGNIYGSTFYMATGFHGFHVIIGTIFLAVCLFRVTRGHFKAEHHFGFEAAAWYWHFVDVVWLFLFAAIYIWGS